MPTSNAGLGTPLHGRWYDNHNCLSEANTHGEVFPVLISPSIIVHSTQRKTENGDVVEESVFHESVGNEISGALGKLCMTRAEVGEGERSEPCHGCDDWKWVSKSVSRTMDECRKEI